MPERPQHNVLPPFLGQMDKSAAKRKQGLARHAFLYRFLRHLFVTKAKAMRVNANGDIILYDEISQFWGISAKSVAAEIAKRSEAETIAIRLNSPGGDVFEGMAIYNTLKQAPNKIAIHIDGIAASAASFIAMAADEVYISDIARMMLHLPWADVSGDFEEMRQASDLLESLGNTYAKVYSQRTGKPVADVLAEWLKPGENKWFTAQEAVDARLADAIEESNLKIAAKATEKQVWKAVKKQSISNSENMQKVIAVLDAAGIKLSATANEDMIAESVKALNAKAVKAATERDGLKAELDKAKQKLVDIQEKANADKAAALVQAALSANKITQNQTAHFTTLAKVDYESTKSVLEAMDARPSMMGALETAKAKGEGYKDWDFYASKNPKQLEAFRQTNKAEYDRLFEEKFGKKPSN